MTGLLRAQYGDLSQAMRTRGLSAAVFTELISCEQELGIVSYDREGSAAINIKNLLSVTHSLLTIALRRLRIVLFD